MRDIIIEVLSANAIEVAPVDGKPAPRVGGVIEDQFRDVADQIEGRVLARAASSVQRFNTKNKLER